MSEHEKQEETTTDVEETNRRLMKLYEYRDTVVNKSRSNSMKQYHREQRETKTMDEILQRMRNIIVDEFGSDSVDELYFEHLRDTHDVRSITARFFEQVYSNPYQEILTHYCTFLETLDWYNRQLSNE